MSDRPSVKMGALVGSRYRVEARVGAGGMGVVYRAHDERLGRSVALKVVSQKGGASAVRRLLREARAVASLEHRGIATLYDALDEPSLGVVLVMELVRGKNLRDLVPGGTCPPGEAARLVADVAASLGAAHRAGLVHRDVKPDNVIVREDGRTALLDFGIAKAMSERHESSGQLPEADTGHSTEGLVVGTPAYLAPEQALAAPEITGAADQFALAVVAYELFTGSSPWRSATNGATLIAQIVGAEPPKPSELRPELPAEVDAVVARAMSKKPTERFESIEAFARALLVAVGEAPTSLPGPSARVDSQGRALPFAKTERMNDPDATTRVSSPSRARRAVVAGGVLAAAVIGLFAWGAHRSTSPAVSTKGGAASDASAPRAVTYADVAPSETRSAEAAKAFHEAMLDLRDADEEGAGKALDEAIRADPELGSAHLQRAILVRSHSWRFVTGRETNGREDYLAAARARASLSARDSAILDAWEPTFNRVPADLGATEARLATLASESRDAQLWNLVARCRLALSRLPPAVEAFTHEFELDPQSAAALAMRGRAQTAEGDMAGARESFEACFRRQPRAGGCRASLVELLDETGDCEAFARGAAEYAAVASKDNEAVTFAMDAIGWRDGPRAALEEKLQVISEPDHSNTGAWIHELYGELAEAAAMLAHVEAYSVAHGDTTAAVYARAARITELVEAGSAREAVGLAAGFDTLIATMPPLEDAEFASQAVRSFPLLVREGIWSEQQLRDRRAAWIATQREQAVTDARKLRIWGLAYAEPAFDERRAAEAMEALPSFVDPLPEPPVRWPWDLKESIARVLVLVHHPKARAFLHAATSDCTPNFYGTRARYWSGVAYEDAGDRASACGEYARVIARWGKAKPRSITADAARARMRALGCADDGGR